MIASLKNFLTILLESIQEAKIKVAESRLKDRIGR